MAEYKDQQQLVDWYEQGSTTVALRHGLTEQTMREWLHEQGYYDTEQGSELAERMLAELRTEIIRYRISCLDPISASTWLLLLSDSDKDHNGTAE